MTCEIHNVKISDSPGFNKVHYCTKCKMLFLSDYQIRSILSSLIGMLSSTNDEMDRCVLDLGVISRKLKRDLNNEW